MAHSLSRARAASKKYSRKRHTRHYRKKDKKRHSPDEDRAKSLPADSSAAYDKVARHTLNIRQKIARRERRAHAYLNSDSDTDSPDMPDEARINFKTPLKTNRADADMISLLTSSPESEATPTTSDSTSRSHHVRQSTPYSHSTLKLEFQPKRSPHTTAKKTSNLNFKTPDPIITAKLESLLSSKLEFQPKSPHTSAKKTPNLNDKTPDAGVTTGIPNAKRVSPVVPLSPARHATAENISGSDSDHNMCDSPSHSLYPFWSIDALAQAPGTIARVNELISHLMVVGLKNSTRTQPPPHTLTDTQRTRTILHDQCHDMLRALHRHLDLLFKHFWIQ